MLPFGNGYEETVCKLGVNGTQCPAAAPLPYLFQPLLPLLTMSFTPEGGGYTYSLPAVELRPVSTHIEQSQGRETAPEVLPGNVS